MQQQAGEDPQGRGMSQGAEHPSCVFDLVFVSIAVSCLLVQCPRSSSARR